VEFSYFQDLNPSAAGGAIYIDVGASSSEIIDSNFDNCRATASDGTAVGGAMYIGSTSATLARLCGESCWADFAGMVVFLEGGAGSRSLSQMNVLGCPPYGTPCTGDLDGALDFENLTDATLASINLSHCLSCHYTAGITLAGEQGGIAMSG
jgi:hypothetical protein